MSDADEAHIRAKVKVVAADEDNFGVLSCGEWIAVAMVLDRYDLLRSAWGTMLESCNRLGYDWMQAALRVQRDGWENPIDVSERRA